MVSILLVDDELAAIEAIASRMDWQRLGIGPVYTAQSAQQARRVFEEHTVDLVLCDIEMPKESGMQLIRWVGENHPATVSLFLTCHADFAYARQALQCGALDYLLKPIVIADLEAALARAVDKLRAESLRTQYQQYGEQWVRNRDAVMDSFWLDLLGTDGTLAPADVQAMVAQRGLSVDLSRSYWPVVCSIRQWTQPLVGWPQTELDFVFHNVLQEAFAVRDEQPIVLSASRARKVALLPIDIAAPPDTALLQSRASQVIDAFRMHLGGAVCVYLGRSAPMEALHTVYAALLALEAQNVSYDHKVFLLGQVQSAQPTGAQIDQALWQALFLAGDTDALYRQVDSAIQRATAEGRMNSAFLHTLYHAFLQALYAGLAERNIPARAVLDELGPGDLTAPDSVEKMRGSIRRLLDAATRQIKRRYEGATVVDMVKAYVEDHIGEELTRDDIAAQVFLNPSYLSRFFHKKTGMPLTAYIASVRMERVKTLLAETSLSVSDIAHRTGFVNMPYFCKVFKRETGMTPMAYRQARQRKG